MRVTGWETWRQPAGPLAAGEKMTAATEQVTRLLHGAGETCHRVFRIAGGAGEDWASWYCGWLGGLSWLPLLLGHQAGRQ